MVIVVVLLALAFLAVLAIILLRRAGGGRFPWLQFYMKGREQGFIFREINLLRRVAVETKLENPTALFWSMKMLDRALKGTIIKYRARSQEQDPEYNLLLSKLFELRKRVEFDQPKYKMGIKSSRKLNPKQGLRIMLPGLGPFGSIVVENLSRYMAVSHPQGPEAPGRLQLEEPEGRDLPVAGGGCRAISSRRRCWKTSSTGSTPSSTSPIRTISSVPRSATRCAWKPTSPPSCSR